jgi:hypothetical protein
VRKQQVIEPVVNVVVYVLVFVDYSRVVFGDVDVE